MHFSVAKIPTLQDLAISQLVTQFDTCRLTENRTLPTELSDKVAKEFFLTQDEKHIENLAPLLVENIQLNEATQLSASQVQAILKMWRPTIKSIALANGDFDQVNIGKNAFTRLEKLILKDPQLISYEQLTLLCKLLPASLRQLTLVNCLELNNDLLQMISQRCPNIEILDITGCHRVTSVQQCSFPKLTEFYSLGTGLNEKYLDALAQSCSKTLQVLHVNDSTYLGDINAFENLLVLKFAEPIHYSAFGSKKIASYYDNEELGINDAIFPAGLKQLIIHGCRALNDKGIRHITEQCKQLELLDLSSCSGITDFADCQPLPCLQKLCLKACFFLTEKTFEKIASISCGKIKELNLWGCASLTNASLDNILKNCPELEILNIWGCSSLSNFLDFSSLNCLQELYVSYRNLNELSILQFDPNCRKSLRVLDITGGTITEIGELENLEALRISQTNLTENAFFTTINSCKKTLHTIDIQTEKDIQLDVLSECHQLRKLAIRNLSITDAVLHKIIKSNWRSLSSIELSFCENITTVCSSDTKIKLPNLTHVILYEIKLAKEALRYLSHSCLNLQKLYLTAKLDRACFDDLKFPKLKGLHVPYPKSEQGDGLSSIIDMCGSSLEYLHVTGKINFNTSKNHFFKKLRTLIMISDQIVDDSFNIEQLKKMSPLVEKNLLNLAIYSSHIKELDFLEKGTHFKKLKHKNVLLGASAYSFSPFTYFL